MNPSFTFTQYGCDMLRTTSFAVAFSLALIGANTQTAHANINDAEGTVTANAKAAQTTADNDGLPDDEQGRITAPEGSESLLELPLPIARAIEQGMVLESQFKAESDLTGWVLSLDGQFTLVYTTPDQRTLISGALINEAGNNLSELYAQKYFPKPDISLLEDATYISIGAPEAPDLPDSASADKASDASTEPVSAEATAPAHRVVYAFFDPSCPFCHLVWKAFQPYMNKGVEIRWIPVAFLSPESRDKAAAILQANNPVAELGESMRLFNTEEQPQTPVKERARRQLQNNMKLMQRFGIQGTPGLIWQDNKGELKIRSGMPKLDEFSYITGLPEQPQSDPELFRFR